MLETMNPEALARLRSVLQTHVDQGLLPANPAPMDCSLLVVPLLHSVFMILASGQPLAPQQLEALRPQHKALLLRLPGHVAAFSGKDAPLGEAILAAVQEVRASHPKAYYLCDPVMGDVGRGLFVRPGIPDFLRKRALSQASVITPNHYEFELLCGGPLTSISSTLNLPTNVRASPS